MAKILFITGATGFVGSHTARVFLDSGWRVRALVRRPDRPGLLPAGVEVVVGGLDDPSAYERALAGCDSVIHAAGLVKARTLAEFRRVNVGGTTALAQAASRACPEAFFVHVSSQSAAGPASPGGVVRESDPPRPVSWYGQSKLEGERALERNFCGRWMIIRPCVIYGPGDPGLLQLFSTVATGLAPLLAGGRGRIQTLAVADLAIMLFKAANRPDLAGRRTFAAGEVLTTGQLVRELAALRRPPARLVSLPAWVVQLAGAVETVRETLTNQPLPFNRDKAREAVQSDWVCDSAPLLADLGIGSLKAWPEGIRETCRWYIDHGWLRPCFAGV